VGFGLNLQNSRGGVPNSNRVKRDIIEVLGNLEGGYVLQRFEAHEYTDGIGGPAFLGVIYDTNPPMFDWRVRRAIKTGMEGKEYKFYKSVNSR